MNTTYLTAFVMLAVHIKAVCDPTTLTASLSSLSPVSLDFAIGADVISTSSSYVHAEVVSS